MQKKKICREKKAEKTEFQRSREFYLARFIPQRKVASAHRHGRIGTNGELRRHSPGGEQRRKIFLIILFFSSFSGASFFFLRYFLFHSSFRPAFRPFFPLPTNHFRTCVSNFAAVVWFFFCATDFFSPSDYFRVIIIINPLFLSLHSLSPRVSRAHSAFSPFPPFSSPSDLQLHLSGRFDKEEEEASWPELCPVDGASLKWLQLDCFLQESGRISTFLPSPQPPKKCAFSSGWCENCGVSSSSSCLEGDPLLTSCRAETKKEQK